MDAVEKSRPNTNFTLLYGVHGSRDGKIANTDEKLVKCFSLAENQVKQNKKNVLEEKNITLESVILEAEDGKIVNKREMVKAILEANIIGKRNT